MNEREYTYDAFISYRHSDLDQYVAETLHKKLETFHLPLSASKSKIAKEKTRIKRVFRDKDELPIASNLADPIVTALKESEFLIVICSPRTPESIWVEREIQTFISLHDRAHILAVLIEGEPVDSFPKILLEEEQSFTKKDGSVILQKIPVEPLAADVRGSSKHEVGKNIKRELLRLVSPLFHCSYDDLKQRHRERKIKRIITASLCTSAFFLCFGSYSTYQALQIKKQSEQIQKQSDEIQKQSDEITKQYNEILVTNLNTLGDTALRLLDSEDRMKSIETALSALPDGSTDTSIPLLSHPQYALSESLYIYQNDSQLLPDRVFTHDTNVSLMTFSPSGERLMSIDDTNTVYIWEAVSGKLITSFPVISNSLLKEDSFEFINESEIVYSCNFKLIRYNFDTKETVWEIDDLSSHYFTYSSNGKYLAVSDLTDLSLVDLENGTILFTKKNITSGEYPSIGQTMAFNQDNTKLAYTTTDTTKNTKGEVSVLDLSSGTVTNTVLIDYPRISCLLFLDSNTLAVASNAYIDLSNITKELIFGKAENSKISLYDLKGNSLLWSTNIDGSSSSCILTNSPESNFLAVQGYDTLFSLSRNTGEIVGEIPMSSSITSCVLLPNGTYGICMLRDGSAVSIDLDGGYSYDMLFQSNSNNLKDMQKGASSLFILPYNSNQISRFAYLKNDRMEKIADTDCTYHIVANKDCTLLLANNLSSSRELCMFDAATGNVRFKKSPEKYFHDYFFAGEDDEYIGILFSDTIEILDANTGDLVKTIDCETRNSASKIVKDEKTNHLFTINSYECVEYDLNTLTQVNIYTFENPFDLVSELSIATNGNEIVAADCESTTGLCFYKIGEKESSRSLDLNTNYVDNLFYSADGTELFVVYKNNDIEIYKSDDLTLINTYTNLDFTVNEYHALSEDTDKYILSNSFNGYLCSSDHEKLAAFPFIRGINVKNNQIYVVNSKSLFTIPIYDFDMLIEEAKRQLQ